MDTSLSAYRSLLGSADLDSLLHLAKRLRGIKIVHINSTREGGGVAEILANMVPLTKELGLDVQWETIRGENDFFFCTKAFHNALQGQRTAHLDFALYEKTNEENAKILSPILQNADIVFIHDPQPLALVPHFPTRKGKWIWRCHIDLSSPVPDIWARLKKYVELYDASIFSMQEFAQDLLHPRYIIPPSIAPFSEKNQELEDSEIDKVYEQFEINRKRPTLLQVSRFDRFKDPIGVIEAYRMAKTHHPTLQLILAGSNAADDPEGEIVLQQVKDHAFSTPDTHVLLLPPTSHRTINALQRGATIILQKSLKEGFGLTVSEALWKSKPVIGGNVGGIRLQITDGQTGFLVDTPTGAAQRILSLLGNPKLGSTLGQQGRQRVKKEFLITRHLYQYLTVMATLLLR